MRKKEYVTFTNMCMIRRGDRVVAQRRVDPSWPGVTFPGGHVEEGESFTDAVIREVFEETGLTIAHPRLCGVKDFYDENGRYVVFLYIADAPEGELRSSEEGEVFFTTVGEMLKMDMVPNMRELIEVFTREDLSEFTYDRADDGWKVVLK